MSLAVLRRIYVFIDTFKVIFDLIFDLQIIFAGNLIYNILKACYFIIKVLLKIASFDNNNIIINFTYSSICICVD